MNLFTIVCLMEKQGSLVFDNQDEKYLFTKVAEGELINPQMMMPMDPQMMAQQAGMQMPQDPSMVNLQMMPQQQMMMPQQQMMIPQQQQQPMMPSMPMAPAEESIVGESITTKDIESLIKIINVLTSLKSKYDMLKKDQMEQLSQNGAS